MRTIAGMDPKPSTLLAFLAACALTSWLAASSAHAQACPPSTTWSPQHQLCVAAPQAQPQPYGAQPYGAQPYAGQPPYAAQPYAGPPYAAQPWAAQPYGTPQQDAYVSRPLWGLFVAGVVTFGAFYLLTVGVTAGLDSDADDGWLYIPLLGPWLEAGLGGDSESWTPLWIPSGIVQLAGVVMAILGLAIQQRVPARADNDGVGAQLASLLVVPFVSPDARSAGALLTGSF